MVLEKTLENPLESKEIQPVHPKGNLSWIGVDCFEEFIEASYQLPHVFLNGIYISLDADRSQSYGFSSSHV